jgi:ATP-dependent HslUV protease ATP-binding subunit HslU
VEATKYTEVGYVGKDVESIIRDLVEVAIKNLKDAKYRKFEKLAEQQVKMRIIASIFGSDASSETIDFALEKYKKGELDSMEIEIDVDSFDAFNTFEFPAMGGGASVGVVQIGEIINKAIGPKKKKKVTVLESKSILFEEEMEQLTETEETIKEALTLTEEEGIVFIDEIDKIAFMGSNAKGGEVSREGVQRDLLPLIEGTTVQTKYGNIKTDHILFIGSGAFYSTKPSDLSPELQGRFPVRVELKPLTTEDMIEILKTPEASLLKQYSALLKAEGVNLEFTANGIVEVAEVASKLNTEIENIGARRLHTILEKILHDVMFNAPTNKGKKIVIDKEFVINNTKDIPSTVNLAKFVL